MASRFISYVLFSTVSEAIENNALLEQRTKWSALGKFEVSTFASALPMFSVKCPTTILSELGLERPKTVGSTAVDLKPAISALSNKDFNLLDFCTVCDGRSDASETSAQRDKSFRFQ